MPITPAELPADVAALQAMVRAQEAELAAARAGIIAQRHEIEKLKARIARLLRQSYGSSSERLRGQVEQFELQLAEIDELLAETESASEETVNTRPEAQPKRRPLPPMLPRETIDYQAPEICPACGDALRPLGEDLTEVLDYVPGSFRVVRHVRPKFSCRSCESIAQAPAPSLPIRRGRAGGRVPDCWRTCWHRNTAIIYRCIGRRRFMRDPLSTCRARHLPTWSGRSRGCCGR